MMRTLLIGICAGITSALLSISHLTGSLLALPLVFAAPLPIMIVTLGWTHWAGLVACVAGAVPVLSVNSDLGLVFGADVALPAWGLGYLALLGRRTERGHGEWYPIGNILAALGVFGALLGIMLVVSVGGDYEQLRDAIEKVMQAILHVQAGQPSDSPPFPPGSDSARVAAMMASVVLPLAIFLWVLTTALSLWLAARIVRASNRLVRPWPDLPATRLPAWSAAGLAAGVMLTFASGAAGMVGEMAVASFLAVYVLIGFAAIHDATRGLKARTFFLITLYVIVVPMNWLLLFVALFGLADQFFDLRSRFAGKRRPSNDNT